MRYPRILVCRSARPRNSSVPSRRCRTKSPVRYRRESVSVENGSATNLSAVSWGAPRYPRATPLPPMYNSPRTPTGTGSIFRSSTYIVVLPIGRPMGTTAASPALAWWTEDQIVVSVGPYMFHTEPQRARSSFAIEPERDSPPHRAFRRGLPVQPAASNICQLAGVPCITVTLYLSSIFVRR